MSSDFYGIEQLLTDAGRDAVRRTREFLVKEVEPVINGYWTREEFPHQAYRESPHSAWWARPTSGYGCPGDSYLFDGLMAMEFARADPSLATFHGVHSGLAMGSIYLCGSDEQRDRYLPAMARIETIGAFGLTEPDVGSGVARAPTTAGVTATSGSSTATRSGSERHVRRPGRDLGARRGRRAGEGIRCLDRGRPLHATKPSTRSRCASCRTPTSP